MEAALQKVEPLSPTPKGRGRPAVARPISHNLAGQRLGRKGRDTRDRILSATQAILAEPPGELITLSEVSRRANVRMGTLYLYFKDMTELVLAVLEPVMASVEEEYLGLIRDRWPDDDLGAWCHRFVDAFFDFWLTHSRLLHLRNSMADRYDERLMAQRVRAAQAIMRQFIIQMDGDPDELGTPISSMATAMMTGLERMATVMTDVSSPHLQAARRNPRPLLQDAEARLMELAIRDCRARQNGQAG